MPQSQFQNAGPEALQRFSDVRVASLGHKAQSFENVVLGGLRKLAEVLSRPFDPGDFSNYRDHIV